MKKWSISLMPILIIIYILTGCRSDEKNILFTVESDKDNDSITHIETNKISTEITSPVFQTLESNDVTQITDVDTDECRISTVASVTFITTAETDLSRTIAETTIVSSTTPMVIESLREEKNIMSTEKKQQERSPILMMSIYESWAYGFEQDINILDIDGFYYNYQTYDEMKKIDINENNWYKKILEIEPIKKDEYYIQVNEESLKNAIDFSEYLADYKDYTMKEYCDIEDYDTGVLSVYGIYYDNDGIPQYVKLCSYGEQTECIDNKDVIDFVNQISFASDLRYIFYDGFKVQFPY